MKTIRLTADLKCPNRYPAFATLVFDTAEISKIEIPVDETFQQLISIVHLTKKSITFEIEGTTRTMIDLTIESNTKNLEFSFENEKAIHGTGSVSFVLGRLSIPSLKVPKLIDKSGKQGFSWNLNS
jgi:hypothetical protein